LDSGILIPKPNLANRDTVGCIVVSPCIRRSNSYRDQQKRVLDKSSQRDVTVLASVWVFNLEPILGQDQGGGFTSSGGQKIPDFSCTYTAFITVRHCDLS